MGTMTIMITKAMMITLMPMGKTLMTTVGMMAAMIVPIKTMILMMKRQF